MVPSYRAVATFYRLSIVTMFPSATVWLQFSTKSFKLQMAVSRKRWEIGPRLLLITNRKSHTSFQIMRIIDLGWPWRSLTTTTVGYPTDSWVSCLTEFSPVGSYSVGVRGYLQSWGCCIYACCRGCIASCRVQQTIDSSRSQRAAVDQSKFYSTFIFLQLNRLRRVPFGQILSTNA